MRALQFIVVLIALGGIGFWLFSEDKVASVENGTGQAIVAITLPDQFSQNAQIGKRAFDMICADCHGPNAVGQSDLAPPLVHKIYEPSHHGDESFQRAVANGVSQHHWPFGDMPPIEGLTRGDVAMIIAYIRELQQANGIQ